MIRISCLITLWLKEFLNRNTIENGKHIKYIIKVKWRVSQVHYPLWNINKKNTLPLGQWWESTNNALKKWTIKYEYLPFVVNDPDIAYWF